MEFWVKNQKFVIQGEDTGRVFQESIHSIVWLASNSVKFCFMPILGGPIEALLTETTQDQCNQLEALLKRYQQVFQTPITLPPSRTHDHQISLEPGSGLDSVRPYWYPHVQKNEIERAVKEMLTTGIIRPSFNPFSSPVLLVKKKDGSWRFCVDCRALNRVTI